MFSLLGLRTLLMSIPLYNRPDGSNRSLLPGDSVQDFFDFALDVRTSCGSSRVNYSCIDSFGLQYFGQPLPRSLPPPPKSIGAMLVEENNVVLASLLQTATREEKVLWA